MRSSATAGKTVGTRRVPRWPFPEPRRRRRRPRRSRHDGRCEEVDSILKGLAAHLAVEGANAALLVDLHGDAIFGVAEYAGEGGGEAFTLLLALRLLCCLAFTHVFDV